MIDLTQSLIASPVVQVVAVDPGVRWIKEQVIVLDTPPDNVADPAPDAIWSDEGNRTGVYGTVSPRVVRLPDRRFRLYYTQIVPRIGFPLGANDYDNASSRILSAISTDGVAWIPEPGVRLSSQTGGAADFRVVSSEVVPTETPGRLRMYFECCAGSQSLPSSIRSAVSANGLDWIVEPGDRLRIAGRNLAAPRIQFLEGGHCRLFCLLRGVGIISALSTDGGQTFRVDEGLRIAQESAYDESVAFAPEIVRLSSGGFVMFYAGYDRANRSSILRATSEDGLNWTKESRPVVEPGTARWDAAKCSEMCLISASEQSNQHQFRMLYEACDGTAPGKRGIWRIASAVSSGIHRENPVGHSN